MELNADFSERVAINSVEMAWVDSPLAGVRRRMLDRIGEEVARATSIVRYEPHSSFSPHVHTGGEEYLVLEGIFQDEHGDYPVGSYVRNPPQSKHTPRSDCGCTIFVKLWQFDLEDRHEVCIDLNHVTYEDSQNRPGVRTAELHKDSRETVRVEQWEPGSTVSIASDGGVELLVLDGQITEQDDTLDQYGWLRVPDNSQLLVTSGPAGARVWIKSGHLRYAQAPLSNP